MSKLNHTDEVLQDAKDAADEIRRLGHLDGAYNEPWTARIIARVLRKYEELLEHITRKALDQHGKEIWGGYNESGASDRRRENIRSWGGHGRECDTCHGCSAETFMTLTIGSYKGRLMLDMCRKCAERLAQVVDARLEDRRIQRNKAAGATVPRETKDV